MTEYCETLQNKYCMNESSFTEMEYLQTVNDILFNCRGIERLRLNLPFQLVGRHCNAATMILANTLKAFAMRPEDDSTPLKMLVLENVTDIAVYHLWMNPVDVKNIMKVFADIEHLVLTLRRHEWEAPRMGFFASCLWHIIEYAHNLGSLCLIGMDHDDRPPRGLKQTKFWQLELENWRARSLPRPHASIYQLTSLELKRVEVIPEVLTAMSECFGSTLEELYLNEVYLKAEQTRLWNDDSKKILWIGVPNQRPGEDCQWIAMSLRASMSRLRLCRASFLAYDQYLGDELPCQAEFDLIDPCGLGRSVSQRFVEVVMGIRQPCTPSGDPVEFLPADSRHDGLLHRLETRSRALMVTEYDTNAYQAAVANTTSRWQKTIDGLFPNCNSNTLDELHYIAETACQGMNEIHRRRHERNLGTGLATESADNLFSIPAWGEEVPDGA